ncbi:MAG: UDP-N-acetylenolpyruvoylglucosamine reductase, partial [Clostridiales bacterium]|nr:UDP-N-acetylenolpyruvoylglucosamine reductase [Clostridiales bacterium]
AQVSTKHAGFVINVGGATCADVLALTDQIHDTVLEKTGVSLELELKRLP